MKNIIIGCIIFLLTQTIVWYQTNAQFISDWAHKNSLILSLFGIPISFAYIMATRYLMEGFGVLWPGRLIGFALGIITFYFLTKFHMGEGLTLKTGITLVLATAIVLINVFWKN